MLSEASRDLIEGELRAEADVALSAERQARTRFRHAQAAQRRLRPKSKPEKMAAVQAELRAAGEAWQAARAAVTVAVKNRRRVA